MVEPLANNTQGDVTAGKQHAWLHQQAPCKTAPRGSPDEWHVASVACPPQNWGRAPEHFYSCCLPCGKAWAGTLRGVRCFETSTVVCWVAVPELLVAVMVIGYWPQLSAAGVPLMVAVPLVLSE